MGYPPQGFIVDADTIKKSLLTTRGDLIRRGAADPERYGISASGAVLTSNGVDPVWETGKGARVYHDAAQEIADLELVPLAFNQERYDTDEIHDTVTNNHRLTCRTAGKYHIWTNFAFEFNEIGLREAHIMHYRTAAVIIALLRVDATTAFATVISLATVYDLAVDDYVYVLAYQNTGVALNVISSPQYTPEFGMQRIG